MQINKVKLATGMGTTLITTVSVCGILCSTVAMGSENYGGIRAFDFNRYFNQQYPGCLDNSKNTNAVANMSVKFHDFARDGSMEAIVVGSSCYAGTGGPDIHSVFRLSRQGKLDEIRISDKTNILGKSIYDDLIGNRNFTFEVQNNQLCEVFTDGSGRERPLTACYRLRGNGFVIDHFKRGPTYRASYDCATAQAPWERTVCGTKHLADADIEMHSLYQKLVQLHPDQKVELEAEQRDWLKKLGELTPYKFYGDALQDAYAARIADLRSRLN